MTRVHTLTVTIDCFDMRELLHRHDTDCLRYRLDEHLGFPPSELARIAWAVGIQRPGRYQVSVGEGHFSWSPPTEESITAPARDVKTHPLCELSGLATNECAHCRGDISPHEHTRTLAAQRRKARYTPQPATAPGTCSRCRYPYGPGTLVRPDPLGGWQRQCCWDR